MGPQCLRLCLCKIDILDIFPDAVFFLGVFFLLSPFRNEFNKFNNTRARMPESIYRMTLRLLGKIISCFKASTF